MSGWSASASNNGWHARPGRGTWRTRKARPDKPGFYTAPPDSFLGKRRECVLALPDGRLFFDDEARTLVRDVYGGEVWLWTRYDDEVFGELFQVEPDFPEGDVSST